MEAMTILGLSTMAALAFNSVRTDSIDYCRNYLGENRDQDPSQPEVEEPAADLFEVIELEDVVYYAGIGDSSVLLVDARDDDDYNTAHIPNALQFDPYFPDRYIEMVLDMSIDAEIVIIYCGGGKCEDSFRAADYLNASIDTPIEFDKIRVFKGGIAEWCEAGHPVHDANGEEGECE
jgi:rhodanese-related sulfurtransferase